VNFRLDAGGESLGLYAPDGTLVDAVAFGPLAADRSEGCYPDGEEAILPMSPPTPGTTNRVLIIEALAQQALEEMRVAWASDPGTVYRVDYSADLLDTNWLPLTVVTATLPETAISDTNPPAAQRYYRISTP